MRDPSASLFTMLSRSILRRCPRCGAGAMFANWASLRDHCATCGLKFEREPGYWTGALIINMAAAIVVFLTLLVGGIAFFWPDVPWNALWVTTMIAMVIVPILFYPWSKSIWMAIELSYHKLDPHEQLEASLRASGDE